MKKLLPLFLLTLAPTAYANQVYNQPTNLFGGYYSQTVNGATFATVYDNFKLNSAAGLSSVSWVGALQNRADSITSFNISIYADNSGAPGTSLYSTTINGNANQSFLITDVFSFAVYNFNAPISFSAAANTAYWLSIVAEVGTPGQYVWESGTGGDSKSYQFFPPTLNQIQVDEAFSLNTPSASLTPEPGSLVLTASGLLVLAGSIRRRIRL